MIPFLGVEMDSKIFVLCIVAMGILVPISYGIMSAIRSATVNKEREQTRREVAAYVAEGSMTADEAERILKAAPPRRKPAGDESGFGI